MRSSLVWFNCKTWTRKNSKKITQLNHYGFNWVQLGTPRRTWTANRQNRNLMRYPVAPWVRMNDLNYSTDICISKHNLRFSTCNILVTYKRCGDIIIIEKNILFLEKNILSNVVWMRRIEKFKFAQTDVKDSLWIRKCKKNSIFCQKW